MVRSALQGLGIRPHRIKAGARIKGGLLSKQGVLGAMLLTHNDISDFYTFCSLSLFKVTDRVIL